MEIKTETKTVRYIEYDGKKFYEDGKGYWLGNKIGTDGKPHRVRLHIYVWEKYNGAVPEGYDVHHIDHDKTNNDIDNLVAMPKHEHRHYHSSLRADDTRAIMNKYCRPKAIEWHGSAEGREWHKEQYKKYFAPKWEETVEKVCEYCGKPYSVTVPMASRSRFCSNNCKTQYRRVSGVDNIQRKCIICGNEFTTNKYSHVKTCCKECASISQSKTKTAKSRHQK